MAKGKKYYTVFKGRNPGVYDDWEDAKEQMDGVEGAWCKGYATSAEATAAWRKATQKEDGQNLVATLAMAAKRNMPKGGQPDYMTNPEVDLNAWAVDASCLGNPGRMEYQCVELMTGRTVFRIGPFEDATNNIGEFLAIVHAMALMAREGKYRNIYSDSVSGMAWVRTHKVKTQLKQTPRNAKVFELLARAVTWLNTHTFPAQVLKWHTERWGEIPADFGRK